MNRQLATEVVRRGDRFINVFPKHQEELAQVGYRRREISRFASGGAGKAFMHRSCSTIFVKGSPRCVAAVAGEEHQETTASEMK